MFAKRENREKSEEDVPNFEIDFLELLKASKQARNRGTRQSFDAIPLELKRLSFPRARFQDKEM